MLLGGYAAVLGLYLSDVDDRKDKSAQWDKRDSLLGRVPPCGHRDNAPRANRGRPYQDYSRLVQTYGADAIPLLLQWRQNGLSRANTRAVDAAAH